MRAPVASIAEQAHREGALLDLDKHNWPWSLMLVPIAKVDLFELANNSVWRTRFGFRSSLVAPPEWMEIEHDADGMTEWGWLNFGFQTYYALLNCGFRLRPTAGTASGVHPVPLGYGRVYVHLDGPFRVDDWIAGLRAGRSFVTTGPMLFVKMNGEEPGHQFQEPNRNAPAYRITGEALSARPLERIEVVVNGQVKRRLNPKNLPGRDGGFRSPFDEKMRLQESAWIAVRCFERQADGRVRFAHTGPFSVEMSGEPIRPSAGKSHGSRAGCGRRSRGTAASCPRKCSQSTPRHSMPMSRSASRHENESGNRLEVSGSRASSCGRLHGVRAVAEGGTVQFFSIT